jgi:hypothetical protein
VVYEHAILLSMAKQKEGKLNRLERLLPDGLLVDAAWLSRQGYSTSLRRQYVTGGWLEQPARQVYRRKQGLSLTWQRVVISLQTLLDQNAVVGGRTALDLQGFAHYLLHETKEVHLYSPKQPPPWLNKLSVGVRFFWHNSKRLFRTVHANSANNLVEEFGRNSQSLLETETHLPDFTAQPWGQAGWVLVLSSPERALLEILNELPDRESFHQVDKLVEGLSNLSPRRLEKLLMDCKSVKLKRLFFFFADRHKHAWLKRIHKEAIDLGKGKRMLVRGGKFNAAYQITVPEDLNAVQ